MSLKSSQAFKTNYSTQGSRQYARETNGSRYSLAEREQKNIVRRGYCKHSSDGIEVTEETNPNKVDIRRVILPSSLSYKTVKVRDLLKFNKYNEGEFIYTAIDDTVSIGHDGLMYFVGTIDDSLPGFQKKPAEYINPNEPDPNIDLVPGRELWLLEGTEFAQKILGADWSQNI